MHQKMTEEERKQHFAICERMLKKAAKEPKRCKWDVFMREVICGSAVGGKIEGKWKFVGQTVAVSCDQAINNVRYNTMEYFPRWTPCVYTKDRQEYIDWKAERK